MKAPSLAVVVCLAAVVTACGTGAAGQPGRPPATTAATAISPRTASAPAGPPPTVTSPAVLTTADSGATVRLRPGQRVTVALAAWGRFSWHLPAAAGAAVTKISASGGYPGLQPARVTFLAVQSGRATLSAIDDTACLHAQPACQPPQQVWRVTVIVTGSNPAP